VAIGYAKMLAPCETNAFHQAILGAFDTTRQLAAIVRLKLGKNLFHKVGENIGLEEASFALIDWAENEAWTKSLITAVYEAQGGNPSVRDLAFSGDGRTLAVGDIRGRILLWDTAERRIVGEWPLMDSEVTGLAFSGNGRTLAVRNASMRILLWDVAERTKTVRVLSGSGVVTDLALRGDGHTLAAGTEGGKVQLWDVPSGRSRGSLDCPEGPVTCLALSPDGKVLVAGTKRGPVVWDLDRAQWIQRARALANRSLSAEEEQRLLGNGPPP
jgi:WD40 repeat protein